LIVVARQPRLLHHCGNVDLIDRADGIDQAAKVSSGTGTVVGKPASSVGVQPTTSRDEPTWRSEMVKGDHGFEVMGMALFEHPPIVIKDGHRETAFFWLDARSFDREAIAVETEVSEQGDVVKVAVVVVDCVAGSLSKERVRQVLKHPHIAVEVVALNLVCSSRRTPQETFGKLVHLASFAAVCIEW
jgi:hypothetical protein